MTAKFTMPTPRNRKLKCSICQMSYLDFSGCNASPVTDGECCQRCDREVVMPARYKQWKESQP